MNEAGEVVGVTFASFSAGQNLNVAIPIQYVDALYNQASPAKAVTVKQFFDAVEHTYPLTYILKNSKDFMGKTVTFQAYVSSMWYYVNNPPANAKTCLILVENEKDVLGWLDPVDYKNSDEMLTSISKQSKEWDKEDALMAIEVWIKTSLVTKNEAPGSFITVSGTLTTKAKVFPDVYGSGSSGGDDLTLSNVKISY